jgi:uncharacterized repeat protein (TIGR04052 family)
MRAAWFVFAGLLALSLPACGDDDGDTDTGVPDTGIPDSSVDSDVPDGSDDTGTGDSSMGDGGDGGSTMSVTLNFAAKVGDEDFACGGSYDNIGTTDSTITVVEYRFYVHDVRLVNDSDEEVPLTIENDGMWALDGTVLLDFEDGTNGCDFGNAAMNSTVTGTVPEGTYTGLRFRMGVPFDQNHNVEAATQPAPLNLTSMWWNWQGGYKFLRIDGTSTGLSGWAQHIGSTGCDGSATGGVTMCSNPNIAEISFDTFDASTDTVVADLALLLQDTDIDNNTDATMPGCQAQPTDPDCAGTFANLGLDHMGVMGDTQTFFRVE